MRLRLFPTPSLWSRNQAAVLRFATHLNTRVLAFPLFWPCLMARLAPYWTFCITMVWYCRWTHPASLIHCLAWISYPGRFHHLQLITFHRLGLHGRLVLHQTWRWHQLRFQVTGLMLYSADLICKFYCLCEYVSSPLFTFQSSPWTPSSQLCGFSTGQSL